MWLEKRSAAWLRDVPAWRAHCGGRAAGSVRVCWGPGSRLLAWLVRADGLVLGRRVLLSAAARRRAGEGSREAAALLEHELVHVEQYRRLGWARFLGRYFGEYLGGRLRGLSHGQAYRDISLEKEARRVAAERIRRWAVDEGRVTASFRSRGDRSGSAPA